MALETMYFSNINAPVAYDDVCVFVYTNIDKFCSKYT